MYVCIYIVSKGPEFRTVQVGNTDFGKNPYKTGGSQEVGKRTDSFLKWDLTRTSIFKICSHLCQNHLSKRTVSLTFQI